jgi:hypothetical protein
MRIINTAGIKSEKESESFKSIPWFRKGKTLVYNP